MSYCAFSPASGCFMLLVFGAYGIAGLIFNFKELSTENNFHKGQWPLNHRAAFLSLGFAQAVIIFASTLGIIATIRRAILIFYGSAFVLLGVFASMIIVGGVCIRDASKDLPHLIFLALQNGSTEDFEWISYIQWESNCCGVHSFLDYNLFNLSTLAKYSLPASCCKREFSVPAKNCGQGILAPNTKVEEIQQIIYKEGCGERLALYHKLALQYAGVEMIVVGMIAMAIAAYLYIGVTNHLYMELNDDPENANLDNSGSNTDNSACPSNNESRNRVGSSVRFADENGNNETSGGGVHFMDPSFRPSQLFKGKADRNNNQENSAENCRGQSGSRTQNLQTNKRKRSGRFRFQKNKSVRTSHIPIPVQAPVKPTTIEPPTKSEPPVLPNVEMQMLFDPMDKYSTLSTTPQPSSISQNNSFECGSGKEGLSEDADVNRSGAEGSGLVHHSSLPQVFRFPFLGTIYKYQKSIKAASASAKHPPAAVNVAPEPLIYQVPELVSPPNQETNNEIRTPEIESILISENIIVGRNVAEDVPSRLRSILKHSSNAPEISAIAPASTDGIEDFFFDSIEEESQSRNRLRRHSSASSVSSDRSRASSKGYSVLKLNLNGSAADTISDERENEFFVQSGNKVDGHVGEAVFLEVEREVSENAQGGGMAENNNNSFSLENPSIDGIQASGFAEIFENVIVSSKECELLDDKKIDLEIPLRDSECLCTTGM